MSGLTTIVALSENQTAWSITLGAGLVVLLVVIILLELLRRSVRGLDANLWRTWVSGKSVVKNTATTYHLKNTRDASDELAEELGHHG